MKKFLAICLCALGAAAFGFTACGEEEVSDDLTRYVKGMRTSVDTAETVDTQVTLTEGGVTVYTFTRHVEIDIETHTASIKDTKTTFVENFEQKTTTTTVAAENVTGATLIGLKLSTALVPEYEIEDGDLTCTVSKDKISEVLSQSVSASSDMTLYIDFEDGKLLKAEYSYKNTSDRTVNVTVTYGY